jgi:hypothetical protein
MKKAVFVVMVALLGLYSCSDDPAEPEETVSKPATPVGKDDPELNETNTYKTSAAVSSEGHAVQYRFDLDAGGVHDFTDWSAVDSIAASWPDSGLYVVKAQARCAEHTGTVSVWSDGLMVGAATEFVTAPLEPDGTIYPWPGAPDTFCVAGAASNKGHELQYRFDFDAAGAGDTTAWDTTSCVAHAWPDAGVYAVKVQARCAEHTTVVSDWSAGKTVTVSVETVTAPDTPAGPTETQPWVSLTLCSENAASNKGHTLEYQFEFVALSVGDTTIWNTADTTAWDTSSCVTRSWPTIRAYEVRGRARCATHTDVVTEWSGTHAIDVDVDQLPEIRFATHIGGVSRPYVHADIPLDTVGVMEPFSISYHGLTVNGAIQAYKYFPLSAGVAIDGSHTWSTDLVDTVRSFSNAGPDMIPSGVFKFAAKCRDQVWAESGVDAARYTEGVCQVVVNYDPDTWINAVQSSYVIDGVTHETWVDFSDGLPDTVPYRSWVRLDYVGWDDARDAKIDCNPASPDECISFQVAYWKESNKTTGANEFSQWQPRSEPYHDTDPNDPPTGVNADSNTFHIGSLEYELFVRSVDEHNRPDGTPPSVEIVGNFDPVIDSLAVEDHLGNRLNLVVVDTLEWNFWKGEGWPYDELADTVAGGEHYKRFSFSVKAWGHDHPSDPDGSGVKAWRYYVQNSQGQFINVGKGLAGFFDGASIDVLDDRVEYRRYYPLSDPMGDTVFDNLASWFDDDLTFILVGRDTPQTSASLFPQWILINGTKNVINEFPDSGLGRHTQEISFTFQVRLVR